jgi:hypothetical protein
MNSEVKTGARSEKENKKDAKNGSNQKKKQKIPAGLALMHGFSSTSVGKCRLTVAKSSSPSWSFSPYPKLAQIEPPPNFGVFNKGRASAKIKVDESKRTKQRGTSDRNSYSWAIELSLNCSVDKASLLVSSLKIDS